MFAGGFRATLLEWMAVRLRTLADRMSPARAAAGADTPAEDVADAAPPQPTAYTASASRLGTAGAPRVPPQHWLDRLRLARPEALDWIQFKADLTRRSRPVRVDGLHFPMPSTGRRAVPPATANVSKPVETHARAARDLPPPISPLQKSPSSRDVAMSPPQAFPRRKVTAPPWVNASPVDEGHSPATTTRWADRDADRADAATDRAAMDRTEIRPWRRMARELRAGVRDRSAWKNKPLEAPQQVAPVARPGTTVDARTSKRPWSAPAGDANGGTPNRIAAPAEHGDESAGHHVVQSSGWDEHPIEPGRRLSVHDGFDTPSFAALRGRSDETTGHHLAQPYRWDEQAIDSSRWLSVTDGFDTPTGGAGFVDVDPADAAVEQNPDDPWTRSADWSPDGPMRRAAVGTDAWPLENRADVSRGAVPDALLRWPEDLAGRWPELPEDRSRADDRSAEEQFRASERLRQLDAEQRGTRWNA